MGRRCTILSMVMRGCGKPVIARVRGRDCFIKCFRPDAPDGLFGGKDAVMSTKLNDVNSKSKKNLDVSAEQAAAVDLVRMANEKGLSLTGPDGLLKQFTKSVLEAALEEEMTEHLGHEKNRVPDGRELSNVRNGTRPKTVLTEAAGQVTIDAPRDRDGTFTPQIVKKHQRRLTGVDEIVLSLYSKGLTTGEIAAHFDQIYGASVSKETVSPITDKMIEEMTEWVNRPLVPGQFLTNVANQVCWSVVS